MSAEGLSSADSLTIHCANTTCGAADSLEELSRILLAAWPKESDLDLLLSVPVDVSVLFHGIVCMPYHEFFFERFCLPETAVIADPTIVPPGSDRQETSDVMHSYTRHAVNIDNETS